MQSRISKYYTNDIMDFYRYKLLMENKPRMKTFPHSFFYISSVYYLLIGSVPGVSYMCDFIYYHNNIINLVLSHFVS